MGHRTVKRVPLDFDAPLKDVWAGYLLPEKLHEESCSACDGSGYSAHARYLRDRWYGKVPFHPAETGSEPLTPATPEVRAFAERNVAHAPGYYGTGETAIVREATRLATMWNRQWCHHLAQADVDVLIDANRLWDFTRVFRKGTGWEPIVPAPTVIAEQVNRWSLQGFGHDSLNCGVVIRAACERLGVSDTCDRCEGHGSCERYPGQRAEADAWEETEPPVGEGWQLWETMTEGSPTSPVFATAEGLACWCVPNATLFADIDATYEDWLSLITEDRVDVGSLLVVREQ